MLSGDDYTAARSFGDEWLVCDDIVQVSFDIIPRDILDLLKQKSIKIGDTENEDLRNFVRLKIEETIRGRRTFDEWHSEIDGLFDSFGITRLTPHHAELVFRMNIFSVYSQGMAQQRAEMPDRFPIAYFSPIRDGRSRHIPLAGYYPADKVPLSPIDYGCRCSERYIHKSQVTGNETPFYEEVPQPDLVVFDQRNG